MAMGDSRSARVSRGLGAGMLAAVAVVLAGMAMPAAGAAYAGVSKPAAASAGAKSSGVLEAVSCLPSRWCMAVGSSASDKSVAWVWERGAWHQLNDPPGDGLAGVSCPTRTFCLATSFGGLSATVVWNGTTWRVMAPAPKNPMTAPSCPGTDMCAVINGVGFLRSGPIAETWNGRAWKSWKDTSFCQTQPSACGDNDVSCSSATTCLTVGNNATLSGNLPEAAVWDGENWHISDPPATNAVTIPAAVSCTGTFCLTIGDQTTRKAYVASYDARSRSWKDISSSAHLPWPADACGGACFLPGTLSCSAATMCMTSGRAGFFAWNGREFKPAPPLSAGRGSMLSNVSCVKAFCVAVGYRTVSHARRPLSELWNGTTWKILPQRASAGAAVKRAWQHPD
jgi:hypothetical protein